VPSVIVPFYPGITSALGLLTTDLKYDFVQSELLHSNGDPELRLKEDAVRLRSSAQQQLVKDGIPEDRMRFDYAVDLRYAGQGYELRVQVPESAMQADDWQSVWNSFHEQHRAEYGHCFTDQPIEIVTVRVTGRGLMPKLPHSQKLGNSGRLEDAWLKSGETYFRVHGKIQCLKTEFYDRPSLPAGTVLQGPAVLFQKDSTTVIPPRWTATIDEFLNVLITHDFSETAQDLTAALPEKIACL
jgi:N-methylhydantoinase A